ncbi:MAG TPA: histidine kinase [Candidatus Sulfopaludibacter sp.]|jgi:sensor histidine kinase YesM|nr:histidine kinase [Candidatus Sulfopaludibacter sp.]
MHPLLVRRRLLLYLLAWIPLLAMAVGIVWASSQVSLLDAAGVLTPSFLVFAFVCLSPWYICRTRPLGVARLAGTVAAWTTAAVSGSLVLVVCAWMAGSLLSSLYPLEGLEQKLPRELPLLFGIGVLLYVLSAGLHYMALAAEQSRDAERRAVEARALAREAELRALKMQINPHFLFNSLHSIAALATADGGRAREMCIRLSDFLRSSLRLADRESIPLTDELALARNYLEVEQIRFGDRLRFEEQVGPACEQCSVPALMLQPLVENAVKHGIAGLVEGGAIRLVVTRSAEGVTITVENGYDPDMPPPRNIGIGLGHVRRRLLMRYGDAASLEAGTVEGCYRVVLRFPCEPSIASISRA